MNIRILTTGGTIDKVYSVRGELEVGPPAALGILSTLITPVRFVVESICAKDSLDLDEGDRMQIRTQVNSAPESHILITHGTDTMAATAAFLLGIDKTVVLTGAMQPACMQRSDAAFNLGVAISALQLCQPGIYVAMGAVVLPARTARKDRDSGIFYSVDA